MPVIRLLLADDHELLRAGLRLVVKELAEDMEVVAEASSAREVITKAESTQPDVILLDVCMPETSGIEAIGAIRRVSPKSRVLVLTMVEEVSCLRSALASGASGFLLKSSPTDELLTGIRAVHRGRSYIAACLSERGAQAVAYGDGGSRTRLSRREREVLELIARGYTYREIAERLSVSIKSVETYRSRLADKLGLATRVDIVSYALHNGYLAYSPPSHA